MFKTLVIPDIHQDIFPVEKILEKEYDNVNEIVFLGDYFDSFYSEPLVFSFRKTCQWLKYMFMDEKSTFLIGNHDISYIYHNNQSGNSRSTIAPHYFCSGFTKAKLSEFRKEFYDNGLTDEYFLSNFKLVHKSNGFLFSHAGLSVSHLPPYGFGVDRFISEYIPEAWKNFRNLSHQTNYLLSSVGFCRGGNDAVGGILWQDWNFDFFPSSDIGKQMVGHTTLHSPECRAKGSESESWNIDTNRKHYAIVTDGEVEIFETPK